MRRYDTIFIADPDLSEENRLSLFDRLKDLITQNDGYIAKFDEWGPRKLAYEVKKKKRGYYVLVDLCSPGALIQEMERVMRIDDRVLKFLTVQTADDIDLEVVKEEVATEKAEKEAARIAAAEKAEAAKLEAQKQQEEAEAKTAAAEAKAAEEAENAPAADAPAEDAPAEDAPAAEAAVEEPAQDATAAQESTEEE